MRDFSEADRKKKSTRLKIQENPGKLFGESLSELEDLVKASKKDGYLSCPVAWRISRKSNVSKIAVRNIAVNWGFA